MKSIKKAVFTGQAAIVPSLKMAFMQGEQFINTG
jgi:hypothetical protein